MEHIDPQHADLLKSFAVVTRFTALINDKALRIAVSHIVERAPHNGSYGFLAASDEVQKLCEPDNFLVADKMNLYTVRDAIKRIHEHLNNYPVDNDYDDIHEEHVIGYAQDECSVCGELYIPYETLCACDIDVTGHETNENLEQS